VALVADRTSQNNQTKREMIHMKKLLLATALAGLAGTAMAQDVVRLGTEGAYPPYNFINDAGEVAGFERELGDELCKRAGLTCEWVVNAWDSIIPNLQSGNYDVIIAGMSITDEREEVLDFSQGYLPPTKSAYLAATADVDSGGLCRRAGHDPVGIRNPGRNRGCGEERRGCGRVCRQGLSGSDGG
jgi:hypothetical protein